MIVTAHQPAYLPWLGYFHKIALSDVFVLLDKVQFEKNSFINRNKMKTPAGAKWLTIPVNKAGYTDKDITQIGIVQNDNWKENHWDRLYLNYKKAPYFHFYADYFKWIYEQEWTNLVELSMDMLNFFLHELNIDTKIVYQSELGTKMKKQELVLEICKKLNADIFVFGALGKNYATPKLFNDNGIEIYFQDYKHPTYRQQWGEFVPYMSIVDLLFNEGPSNALDIIMKDNIRKKDLEKNYGKNISSSSTPGR